MDRSLIYNLDINLFNQIQSQGLTDNDKRSLLSLIGGMPGNYEYLEIGSLAGASLQVAIADQECKRVYSIDPRPQLTPDQRGYCLRYDVCSPKDMVENLESVPGADLSKLSIFTARSTDIDPDLVGEPDICFIDGEHTEKAVLEDALWCAQLAENITLVFHDVWIVHQGISRFIEILESEKKSFQTRYLPDTILAIEIGNNSLLKSKIVIERSLESGRGILNMLSMMRSLAVSSIKA